MCIRQTSANADHILSQRGASVNAHGRPFSEQTVYVHKEGPIIVIPVTQVSHIASSYVHV